jgi:ABC-type bacteriocin/lantibiotic exporter with double-glycine peptidase domain
VRKFKTKRNLLLGIIAVIFEIGSVFLAVKLRYNGEVEISTIVLVLMFVGRFVGQLSIIPNIIDDVSRIMGESKKPLEILNTPHEIVDKTERKLKV